MRIPKVIHQTWKTGSIPAAFIPFVRTWQEHHPGWTYQLWTDQMNRAFIARHFPDFLACYDHYPAAIQRVDAVRYLILYKIGGLFVDMDYECLRDVSCLLEEQSCVFGLEPEAHCRLHRKNRIISNAFMAAAPGLPFFEALYRELLTCQPRTTHPFDRILESTGPFMLTRVYEQYPRKEEIRLADSAMICPFTKEELEQMQSGHTPAAAVRRMEKGYAIHHYKGTWWRRRY